VSAESSVTSESYWRHGKSPRMTLMSTEGTRPTIGVTGQVLAVIRKSESVSERMIRNFERIDAVLANSQSGTVP
jgi:hypothetical protein